MLGYGAVVGSVQGHTSLLTTHSHSMHHLITIFPLFAIRESLELEIRDTQKYYIGIGVMEEKLVLLIKP